MAIVTHRILIVEDERPLAHALELKLQHEGFTTTVATNGQEALAALSEHYDLMLLDMMMPVMDGFQVLEHLQAAGNTIPVFALSNLSQHEDEERVRALGAVKYLIKSNTPLSQLVEEVKKQL